MDGTDLLEIIQYINPAVLDYQDWVNVGMALKHEGYTAQDWDSWSQGDPGRYHRGECERKWGSFNGSAEPVTGGTIVKMAMDHGWQPEHGHELDWESPISAEPDSHVVVDKNWLEGREVHEPEHWDPVGQLTLYLETLFAPEEKVGYVVSSYRTEKGKYVPQNKGNYDRTAGQLLEALSKCNGDIGAVVGDYSPEGGAWIRFNPLDGTDVKNANVTEFKYALVESDSMEIAKQNAILRELELPIAVLVHSGGKSLHAIVRVDASDYREYRKRVDYLYDVCKKNGLVIDQQNRNPSRLSRMPGAMRNGHKQFIVGTNLGKASWDEWHEWIEGVNDSLPEPESLESVWGNLPDLAPCLIENVLRKGHKMLIAGPSKAGKSFLLIELCIAIAEGKKWLGWPCAKGKILYVNLELDRASCLHRFKDVYDSLGILPNNLGNIDIWNLRGKSIPMDKLAPKLIRRAAKKDYTAVIIDPIYKVITGDENSADQMSNFCNQFDKVCTDLGCAVIYCHHHSKGAQGAKKSIDRASGSGVFARDPDALLDLIQLETTDALMDQTENKAICEACKTYLDSHFEWRDDLSQDDLLSPVQMLNYCKEKLNKWQLNALDKQIKEAKEKARQMTAWRIEATLREFRKPENINLWFDYPIHILDDVGSLKDIQEEDAFTKVREKKEKLDKERKSKSKSRFQMGVESFRLSHEDVYPTVTELYEEIKASCEAVGEEDYPKKQTIRNSVKKYGYRVDRSTSRLVPLGEKDEDGEPDNP